MKKNNRFDDNHFSYFINEESRKNSSIKEIIVIIFTLIFIILSTILISFASSRTKTILPSFLNNDSNSIALSKISELENNLKKNNEQILAIKNNLSTTSDNINIKNISIRLNEIENTQNAMSETILEDADKVITTKLLREKQKEIENNISEIKVSVLKLNDRLDSLVTTLVAIPLIGFILSLIGTLVYFLINISRNKNKKGYQNQKK